MLHKKSPSHTREGLILYPFSTLTDHCPMTNGIVKCCVAY